MRGRQRQPVFDKPGKATVWAVGSCVLTTLVHMPGAWVIGVTVLAALAACFNG